MTLFQDPSVYDLTPSPIPLGQREGKDIIENDYIGKTYQKTIPNFDYYKQRSRRVSLGQILTEINKIKLLIQQPRQAWNVYGFNIKNLLVGSVVGKISATQINLTKPSNSDQAKQGSTNRVTVINND